MKTVSSTNNFIALIAPSLLLFSLAAYDFILDFRLLDHNVLLIHSAQFAQALLERLIPTRRPATQREIAHPRYFLRLLRLSTSKQEDSKRQADGNPSKHWGSFLFCWSLLTADRSRLSFDHRIRAIQHRLRNR